MAKPINLSNPVAATRSLLRLSLEDFSAHVGLGVSTLKLIESGQRKLSHKMAETIALRVAVPADALLMKKWTDDDRQRYRPRVAASFGHFEEMEVLELIPKILALYYAMSARGVDPRFSLMAINREIKKSAERWGIDLAELRGAELDIQILLQGVSADRQGIDTPPLSAFLETVKTSLSQCETRIRAMNASDGFNARLTKSLTAGISNEFIGETISRASKKRPFGKGALGTKIDQLPVNPAPKRRGK